jgi:hypothetical protein
MLTMLKIIPFILITLLIVNLASVLSINTQVPITYIELEVQPADIYAGSSATIRVFRTRHRSDCVIISNRQAKHIDGTFYNLLDAVYIDSDLTPYTDITFSTPSYMKLGTYTLRANITYLCAENQTFFLRQPIVEFTITERPPNG